MISKIGVAQFIELSAFHPVLDVRSPGEFSHAHIPGAHQLPLFADEERKVVGTAYKQQGREAAIKIGLDYFGPKMRPIVEAAERILQSQTAPTNGPETMGSKAVLVHCWRGGMRSGGVAWLLDLYGFKVYTLSGGYKAFRNWVLQQLERKYPLLVVGGYTGCGKTKVLRELQKRGEAVIDIEALAHHKGSAFGDLGESPQPSAEMFGNKLALALYKARSAENIWIEDESQRIGDINMQHTFWRTMREAPVYIVDVPFEARLHHLVETYGKYKQQDLINATLRIQKRLGGLNAKNVIGYIVEQNYMEAFRILLTYYDKFYKHGLDSRDHSEALFATLPCPGVDAAQNAVALLTAHSINKSTLAKQ